MIDYVFDTFRLYLAKNNQFVKRYIISSKEKAYELIDNLQDEYNEYLLIGHINSLNEDVVIEHEYLEHKTRKRER